MCFGERRFWSTTVSVRSRFNGTGYFPQRERSKLLMSSDPLDTSVENTANTAWRFGVMFSRSASPGVGVLSYMELEDYCGPLCR